VRGAQAQLAFQIAMLRQPIAYLFTWFAALLLAAMLAMQGASAQEAATVLEERVAELEAISLRKGDRKLTLQVYGQINRALLFWNDGFDKDWNIIDNTTSSSRWGIIGERRLRPGTSVGFRLEFEFGIWSEEMSNTVIGSSPWAQDIPRLRHAYWYASDQALGRISLGHQSPATDDITLINLGSQMNDAAVHYNTTLPIPLAIGGRLVTDLRWGDIAHNVDALRGEFVRYDTPALLGFVLSGAWGENDIWDVGLRYQKEWSSFRFAAGIGFMDDREHNHSDLKGSASLLHMPSGLYVSAAGGLRDDEVSTLSTHGQAYFYYAQLGIRRQWLRFGDTTLYADHGLYKNFNVGDLLRVDPQTGSLVIWGTLAQTEVHRWGFGIEQAFDAAGLLLYAQAHHYDVKIVGFPCDPNPSQFANNCGGDPTNLVELPTRPWSGVVVGARIQF
jgi:predicted porin